MLVSKRRAAYSLLTWRFFLRERAVLSKLLSRSLLVLAGLVLPISVAFAEAAAAADGNGTMWIGGLMGLAAALLAAIIALFYLHRKYAALGNELLAEQRSAAAYQQLLTASPDPYLVIWSDSRLEFSPELPRLLALADGNTSAESFADLQTTASGQSLTDWLDLKRDSAAACEVLISDDGNGRKLRVTGKDFATPGGKSGQIVFFKDRTEVEALETSLAAATSDVADIGAKLDEFEALLAAVKAPIWRRQADLSLSWCNAAYEAAVGASPGDAVERKIEIETALIPNQAQQLARKAVQTAAPASEIRYFVIAGQRRALEITEIPAPDDGVVGFAQDVTDQVEIRAELSRHINAQAEVLNNINTAIVIYGPDKRVDYNNLAYATLWRLDEEWLASKPTHAEVLEKMRENRQLPEYADFSAYRGQLFQLYTDLIEPMEDLLYKPDGRILRRIVTPHPFGGLMFVEEDVTDSLALERSYNTLIATQSETLDNLYEGVAVYGGDGRLKLFNPAFAEIWRLSEDMLEAEPHVSDVLEATRGIFQADDWEGLKHELVGHATGRDSHSLHFERTDGSVIDYACVALPDGNVLLTYVDITDTATIERALRERNLALEEADRLKTEFIANMSYELRTPLNSIIGFTDMLKNQFFGELNERQFEYIGHIRQASADLLTLINSVLDLASIEADRMELLSEEVDIYKLSEQAVSLVLPHARRKEMELETLCPRDIGTFMLDADRIRQVLMLLLTNAVDYTEERGRVSLGARKVDGDLDVWVEDTGVGIDPEDHQRIFEKFQYGGNAMARHGVGLGLSLVKSIIELHGGKVDLTSQVGIGTRLSFRLPYRQVDD